MDSRSKSTPNVEGGGMKRMQITPRTIWFYSNCHDCVVSAEVTAIDEECIFYNMDDERVCSFSNAFDSYDDAVEWRNKVINKGNNKEER